MTGVGVVLTLFLIVYGLNLVALVYRIANPKPSVTPTPGINAVSLVINMLAIVGIIYLANN